MADTGVEELLRSEVKAGYNIHPNPFQPTMV
jgi:hypothetical protein